VTIKIGTPDIPIGSFVGIASVLPHFAKQ